MDDSQQAGGPKKVEVRGERGLYNMITYPGLLKYRPDLIAEILRSHQKLNADLNGRLAPVTPPVASNPPVKPAYTPQPKKAFSVYQGAATSRFIGYVNQVKQMVKNGDKVTPRRIQNLSRFFVEAMAECDVKDSILGGKFTEKNFRFWITAGELRFRWHTSTHDQPSFPHDLAQVLNPLF